MERARGRVPRARAELVVLAGIAVVVGAFSFGSAQAGDDQASMEASAPRPVAHAVFHRVENVQQLMREAPVTVVAEVTQVSDGVTMTFDHDKTDRRTRSPSLPSKDVELTIIERLRGEVGDQIMWWVPLAPGKLEIDGDSLPQVGDRYVLFLAPHPTLESRWAAPALDGKLKVDATTGGLIPTLQGGVGAELASHGLTALRETVR